MISEVQELNVAFEKSRRKVLRKVVSQSGFVFTNSDLSKVHFNWCYDSVHKTIEHFVMHTTVLSTLSHYCVLDSIPIFYGKLLVE